MTAYAMCCKALLPVLRRWKYSNVCLRVFVRKASTTSDLSFFVTTPIFYVNAAPHLGHLHSAVMADALHRLHRMLGAQNTIFTTGNDEHGLKIQQAAENQGQSIQYLCDTNSSKFQELFQLGNISHTDFIRTTEDRHITAVKHFWLELVKAGCIYQGKYEGWYCTPEESFLPESRVKEVPSKDGKKVKVSIETGHVVEWMEETNYMFALSKYENDLLHWLRNGNVVKPSLFGTILQRLIEEGLHDLSVSRPKSRLQWGISVPNDEQQIIYVWLDALVNYLTVSGYPHNCTHWPPDAQIIGKDILKFHGIYWPAFLIAAGLEPPRRLLCHSHWMVDHEKMSKSKGNVVDPFAKIQASAPDAVRYFLLREGVPHSDGNYSLQKFTNLVNSELANTLGNFLNICVSKSVNPLQIFPYFNKEVLLQHYAKDGSELVSMVTSLPDAVKEHYLDFNFYKGIVLIMDCLRHTNLFIQECKPWKLTEPLLQPQREAVLCVAMETLRVCGILLLPITPSISDQLLDTLGVKPSERSWHDLKPFAVHVEDSNDDLKGHPLGQTRDVLFKRLTVS